MAVNNDTSVKFTSSLAVKSGLGLEPIKPYQLRITADDLTDADTSQSFSFPIPAGSILVGIAHRINKLFGVYDEGETATAVTLDLGDANADRLLDAVDLLVGSGSVGYVRQDPTAFGDATVETLPLALGNAVTSFTATITSATANVGDLTRGSVDIFLYLIAPSDPLA